MTAKLVKLTAKLINLTAKLTTKLVKLTTKLVKLMRAAQGVFDLKLVVNTQSQTRE